MSNGLLTLIALIRPLSEADMPRKLFNIIVASETISAESRPKPILIGAAWPFRSTSFVNEKY